MRFRKPWVHLHRVAVLNRGLAELSLIAVAVPAFQKLLFTRVGIAIAAGIAGDQQRGSQKANQ